MPARLHPGVYVEEVPSGARSIEAAGTSTAIFVGDTERGPLEPTRIKGVADYERAFGGYKRHDGTPEGRRVAIRYAIGAFFANGGTSAYVLRALDDAAVTGTRLNLEASSPGAWSQDLAAVIGESSDGDAARFRIFVVYTPPGGQPTVVERWDRLSIVATDENYAPDVLRRSLYVRWQEGAPVVAPTVELAGQSPQDSAITAAAAGKAFAGGTLGAGADYPPGSLDQILPRLDEVSDAALLVVPAAYDESDLDVRERTNKALSYAMGRARQDLFCIADLPRNADKDTTTAASDLITDYKANISPKTNFGAVYFPWVEVSDPVGVGRDPVVYLGPSGFVAGLYARTDQRRGVWKAPAGLEAALLNVRRLEYNLLDAHQDDLNPLGINALRVQPAGGNVVWGARTLEPGGEWRYVPVRRMAIFLRTSIYNGIQWAVFEPNDEPLWSQLRLTVGGFMEQMFRQGAFAGKTTREAFFVKCDAETTPESDQIAGVVNIWVGFAPLRPAEFVVVRLSQIVNQKA